MCGRFALFSEPSRFAEFLDAELALDPEAFRPSWNVGPTRTILGVAERADGHRSLGAYRWGLVPGWAKEPSAIRSTFNARAETVATKPTFRSAFRRGRILIPADAFYEWQTEGRVKTPFAFTRADGNPIVFAGLGEPGSRARPSLRRHGHRHHHHGGAGHGRYPRPDAGHPRTRCLGPLARPCRQRP